MAHGFDVRAWLERLAQALLGLPPVPPLVPVRACRPAPGRQRR
jgi:hypothetical protein